MMVIRLDNEHVMLNHISGRCARGVLERDEPSTVRPAVRLQYRPDRRNGEEARSNQR